MTLVTVPLLPVDLTLAQTASRAEQLIAGSRADATRRAYRSDWHHFETWTRRNGLASLPAEPQTVGLYLVAHEGQLSVATLARRLSSISTAHRMAGAHLDTTNPAIRDTMRGLRRAYGSASRQTAALTLPLLKRVVGKPSSRLIELRDRALILVGFAAALRRSELVALDVTDISVTPDGLRVAIRRSKGDQDGRGAVLGIDRTGSGTCPVDAYLAWQAASRITDGPAFRSVDRHGRIGRSLSARAVALIVKRRAALAGMESAQFAGHSMRAGFATSAAEAGIEERVIARQTRHKSMTVLRGYIREGTLFHRRLGTEIGL